MLLQFQLDQISSISVFFYCRQSKSWEGPFQQTKMKYFFLNLVLTTTMSQTCWKKGLCWSVAKFQWHYRTEVHGKNLRLFSSSRTSSAKTFGKKITICCLPLLTWTKVWINIYLHRINLQPQRRLPKLFKGKKDSGTIILFKRQDSRIWKANERGRKNRKQKVHWFRWLVGAIFLKRWECSCRSWRDVFEPHTRISKQCCDTLALWASNKSKIRQSETAA